MPPNIPTQETAPLAKPGPKRLQELAPKIFKVKALDTKDEKQSRLLQEIAGDYENLPPDARDFLRYIDERMRAILPDVRTKLTTVRDFETEAGIKEAIRKLSILFTVASVHASAIFPDPIDVQSPPGLNAALSHLYASLRSCKERSDKTGDSPPRATGFHVERLELFLTLFEPITREILNAPLILIYDALRALDSGATPAVLKPTKRSGRPQSTEIMQAIMGAAAYVVDRLRAVAHSPKEARKVVAHELNQLGVKPERGSGKITERTVRGWCETVSEDVLRERPLATTFHLLSTDPEHELVKSQEKSEATSRQRH